MEEQDYNCYVYVVRTSCGQFVKVGRTRDLESRIYHLKHGLFADVDLMAWHGFKASELCTLFERYLHNKYKDHKSSVHRSAEWFNVSALDGLLTERFDEKSVFSWMLRFYPGFSKRVASYIDPKTRERRLHIVKPFR